MSMRTDSDSRWPLTEREVAEFLSAFNRIALLHSSLDAADHHGADADGHDATKLRRVDWNNLPRVLSVHIECCPDGLRL